MYSHLTLLKDDTNSIKARNCRARVKIYQHVGGTIEEIKADVFFYHLKNFFDTRINQWAKLCNGDLSLLLTRPHIQSITNGKSLFQPQYWENVWTYYDIK